MSNSTMLDDPEKMQLAYQLADRFAKLKPVATYRRHQLDDAKKAIIPFKMALNDANQNYQRALGQCDEVWCQMMNLGLTQQQFNKLTKQAYKAFALTVKDGGYLPTDPDDKLEDAYQDRLLVGTPERNRGLDDQPAGE